MEPAAVITSLNLDALRQSPAWREGGGLQATHRLIPLVLNKVVLTLTTTILFLLLLTRSSAAYAFRAGQVAAGLGHRAFFSVARCKPMVRLRKKLVHEFMLFMLGPLGTGIVMMVFWPGWWLLGMVFAVRWWIVG